MSPGCISSVGSDFKMRIANVFLRAAISKTAYQAVPYSGLMQHVNMAQNTVPPIPNMGPTSNIRAVKSDIASRKNTLAFEAMTQAKEISVILLDGFEMLDQSWL